MNIDLESIAKLASPLFTLILGALIKRHTEGRSKVISYIGHISSFTLNNDQHTPVFTHSVIVRNAGRKAAHNVRLGHNVFPQNIKVDPNVQYSIEHNPEGAVEIVLPILAPREQITISYLYFPPLTWAQINVYAKSDEGLAKIVNVIPTPQPRKIFVWLFWGLAFIGASFLVYWLVRLIAYII